MTTEPTFRQAAANDAKAKPIVTRGQPNQPPGIAPFFVEEIRKHLEQQYGAKVLYENGLSVTTTLDVKLQEAANRAIETGLRRILGQHSQPSNGLVFSKGRFRSPVSEKRKTGPFLSTTNQSKSVGRCVNGGFLQIQRKAELPRAVARIPAPAAACTPLSRYAKEAKARPTVDCRCDLTRVGIGGVVVVYRLLEIRQRLR